ncbi:MAG: HAD family phosphatase [Epulopiscium sp.]|nr:HAD family phosphatase [Candidatus Epulonipiscium sp.]
MKAAVFDIDGTLADSMEFWNNISRNYLISQGILPKENLNKILESLTVMESVDYMKQEYGLKKDNSIIKDELNEILFEYYKNDLKLKPYAVDLIKALRSKNVKLAVASVTDEKLINILLKRYGIYDDFDFIQTCDNIKLSKEDKQFYRILSKRLDVEPKEIFLFEDSLYSMITAKSLDFRIVGVEDSYSSLDLKDIIEISDIYIKSFKDFISLIKI